MPPPRLHSTLARDQGLTVEASGHQPAVHACSVFPSTGLLARPCHSPNTEAPAGSAADTQRKQEYRIAWNPCTQRPCVHLTPRCPTNEACQSVPILSLRDQGPAEAQVMGRISPEALLQPLPPQCGGASLLSPRRTPICTSGWAGWKGNGATAAALWPSRHTQRPEADADLLRL